MGKEAKAVRRNQIKISLGYFVMMRERGDDRR